MSCEDLMKENKLSQIGKRDRQKFSGMKQTIRETLVKTLKKNNVRTPRKNLKDISNTDKETYELTLNNSLEVLKLSF